MERASALSQEQPTILPGRHDSSLSIPNPQSPIPSIPCKPPAQTAKTMRNFIFCFVLHNCGFLEGEDHRG